ncbi:MAG: class I SAM-dependent methyltransferase [Alphaproteobacteria bacterium]
MPETVPCNLCGSSEATPRPDLTEFLELPAPLEIRQCRACGLHYMSPRPTPDELVELYAKEPYFSEANADRGASRLDFYGARMGRLERHSPGRGTLLGIGCLEGGYALEIAQSRRWNVTGVESSEILAGYARKHLKIDVRTVHGWDLSGFEAGHFDAAYTHSFEHFSDPRRMLREIRRVLKPNGKLMVEAPYQFYSLKDLVRRKLMRLLGDKKRLLFRKAPPFVFHLYYFEPDNLRALLKQEGFEVVEFHTYVPFHPVYARNPRGHLVQEGLYALGGLFGRGPSMEVTTRAVA